MANTDAIRAWVEDLRSGKFKQGRGQLRKGGRFCCLGVACETYRRATGDGRWSFGVFYAASEASAHLLPSPVSEWLGLEDDPNPNLRFPRSTTSCGEANDHSHRSFSAIADAIERTYLPDTA